MSLRDKAHEKMLKEMNEEHTPSEDHIHNWLCKQDDEKLLQGIISDGKSIKGSLEYCASKSHEYESNSVAMVHHETVFGWVREYFVNDDIKPKKITPKPKPVESKPQTKKKKENKSLKIVKSKTEEQTGGVQLDLLDFL